MSIASMVFQVPPTRAPEAVNLGLPVPPMHQSLCCHIATIASAAFPRCCAPMTLAAGPDRIVSMGGGVPSCAHQNPSPLDHHQGGLNVIVDQDAFNGCDQVANQG